MPRRKNGKITIGAGLTGTLTLGAVGWLGVRLYTRQRVLEELETKGLSSMFGFAKQATSFVSLDLNLPPPVILAKSMVPLWGFNTPYAALDDISVHGRESKYWPSDYREPSPLAAFGLERLAFASIAKEGTE